MRFIPRLAVMAAFASFLAGSVRAESKKTRVYDAGFEAVWAASSSAAREGFLLDRESKEHGALRFRAGQLRAYRFEVAVTPLGPVRTRVEIEFRTNRYWINRDAWRDGDRYLTMISHRLDYARRK